MALEDRLRDETRNERADRNLSELLQELRVAIPGVQVVFGFLLTVPFSQRFESLTSFQKYFYFGTLLSTALATALFVAPSANHRMLFRKRDKEHIVLVANRLAIAGLASMAVSMCGAILLVSDLVFGALVPAVTTGGAAIVFGWSAGSGSCDRFAGVTAWSTNPNRNRVQALTHRPRATDLWDECARRLSRSGRPRGLEAGQLACMRWSRKRLARDRRASPSACQPHPHVTRQRPSSRI